jgi:small subunit ribosomal protein S20
MANTKSAKKRIRNSARKRLLNRFQKIGVKRAIKDLLKTTDPAAAKEKLPKVISGIDKLAKRNIIHKNNAANKKSKLAKYVNKLSTKVS